MAEKNPGQENLAYDATTNKPRLDVDVTFDENTSLDDIKNKYTDISNQYNRFVTDARQNVADRQTERIGNDFGVSPYNTNTYYESGLTNFASAMRQQGTQKALEVGMERGQKEAEANLAAAESAYQNAVTAYDNAYDNFQRTKNKPVAATIDKSLLPKGVNEDEFAAWISSAGSPAEGMQRAIDTLGINNAGVKNWNDADVVNKVKNTLGENSDAWKAYAKHMQEREAAGQVGVSERFGDTEVGRIWADTYAKEYFQANYDDSFTKAWQENYDKVRRLVTNLMGLRNDELSWTEVIIPKSDTPDNMSITADYTYMDIIQPEFKGVDKASAENVKVNSDGSYTIDGKTYSFDEVRETVAKAQGKDLAKLDEQQAKQIMTPPALSGSDLSATQDFIASTRNNTFGTKWQPTLEEIYSVYAGDDAYREMYSGYKEIPISADDVAEAVLGVDIAEARALARLADENPEGFEKLTDQITKALTDTLVFEVADGVKEYHTRDGYKVLEAGTVVMNVPDSVLNADGSVRDKDLEKMIQLYQDYDDPTVDKTALMDEYVSAWTNYATRLLWARAITNQTDELIDSDIYAALLYSSDKEEYKDIKIGDKTAEELLNEFKKKTEDNPDEAYREFTELWQNAYENLGYFYVKMGDTLQETPLFAKDGTPMVGRYGEKNSRSNLSSNYSMALVALYSSSMDAYNAGNKAENINPDFIEADGAGWLYTLWTDLSRTIMADAGIVLSGAAGGILGAATGTAAGPVVGNIIGGLVGTGVALYNAVTDPDPFGPGDYGYDVARNNKSSELLRKAVNPLSEALWGLDDEEDPINFGASYEFIHGVGEFASGILTNVVAMSVETISAAGLEAVGTRLVTSLKKGVGSAAKKLLSAGQQEAIKSVKGAAANIMAEDLANPTDEVTQNILANAARDVADPSDEIVEGAAGKAAANVSGKADDAAAAAAKTRAAMDKAAQDAAKKLNRTANETTDAFMRVLSQLANGADNAAGFSQKLGQKAAPWLTEENVAKALVSAGVSNVDDATVKTITNSLRQTITELGELASKETYRVALIAGFLGKSTDDVARASSGVLEYLAKAIGKWYENPRAASNFFGIWKAQASGKMTMESIKRAFADVIDTSARALAAGMKYTKNDLVRQLARNGWSNKRIQLLFKDAILGKHGLLDDMLYDIVHGYTTPYIDDEGEARQVTVGEYFTDGYFLTSLGTNAVQTIGGALFRRLRLAATNKSLDKAHRALAATEYTDPNYAKRYNKVKQLTAKADKIVNDLLEKNLDYSKMQEVAKRGHQYIDEANNSMVIDSAGRAKAVEKNFNRKTRAQQAEFLRKRFKAPDAVAQRFVNAQTDAFISFPEIRTALGGAEPNRLSTLEERSTIGKIWKAMANAADKYRNEIKNNKRFKTIWDKQSEMRRLQKEAAMEVLRGPDGGTSVEGVDSALDSWFNFIDDVAKKNVASGDMTEAQVRLGYLPTTGMLVGSPNDGVPSASRCLWMGDKAGKSMAVESADPVARREINVQTLIDAYIKGEKTITYTNASGNTVTAEFNPKGFEFVDAVVSYRNANTFHRTVGAILGGDAKTTGRAAVETGYVQFHGDKLSKAAATADRNNLDVEISAMEAKAKAKRTAKMQKADAKARKAAQKALSELAKREDSVLKQVGLHEVNAADMRASASLLRDIATKGRRPDNAPSVKDLLGVKDDSEAQAIFNRARARIESDIRKVQSGGALDSKSVDSMYVEMISEAARHNGAYDYDVVVRRMLLDNEDKLYQTPDGRPDLRPADVAAFEDRKTPVNLKYNKDTHAYEASTLGELAKIDLDKSSTRSKVEKELTRLISDGYNSSDRGLKEQYMRVVQDAFSQARTIMDDQIKLEDIEGGEGGFARGFFTFVDTVDRLLPDKELYNTAVNNKLVTRLSTLGKDGITISQLKDSVLSKISIEKASGSNISDLITAYKVLDMVDDAGTRAAGSGSYTPGRPRSGELNLDDDNEFSESISNGVANIFGRTVDTTDAYSSEFNAEDLMSGKPSNPVQIDYNRLNSKEKTIYDMVRSGVDLSNKSELKQALDTTSSVISKLTNNGSKLYDANLRALRDDTAAVFKSANTVRDEINAAVSKLAKTDAETKALVDAEAARRAARQKQYKKTSTASAKYDGSAALGIARPGSAILYSVNPARYNAVASSLRKGDSGLANNVTALRGQGVHDAESILGYLRQNEPGIEELDSLINFDAGTPAGIYHQLRSAADYLKEKGVDTSSIDSQLADMRGRIGNLDSYGDIYGNTNPPEFSLAAALAEIENKTSFFPDSIRNGVDRMQALDAKYTPSHSGWKDTGHPNFKTEFTEAGESTDPGSVIVSLSDGESGNENLKLHLVDDNGNPVDISELATKTRIKNFNGLILEDAGPQGETVRIVQDGESLRAEYDIDRTGGEVNNDFFRGTLVDEKWAEYLYSTKNKMSSDDLLKEADKLEKLADGAEKKASGASRKKVDIDDGSGKTKKKSFNSLKDDLQDINYKKYMTADEYARYNELKTLRGQADDFVNGKAEVYHSVNGATFNGDAPGYSNMVRASDFLKQYGYNPGSKQYDESKFNAKQMRKELRKGNLQSKKNWGKPVIDPTALPSTMDKESAELTVSHMLNFIKEVQAASNMQYVDMDQIWVDKSYLELLARYANTPNKPSKLIQFANKIASMSQFVQQNQLAGGFGPMNALVLAQIRSAILENPTKAIRFARMMADFRNSRSAVTSVLERSDLLAQIAMDTMDGTVVTDLYPAMSKRVGRDDGGVLQTFATQVLDRLDKSTSRYPKGFVANLKNDIEEFFENPTFAQALPVMRAQMLSMNYDAALTKLSKRFADRIGKDISVADIQRAARQISYARTQKFFFPQKFWNGDVDSGIKKIQNENLRKLVGQITGEGTPTTVTDLASSAFFALRYKQTFVNRFVQGVRSFSDVPKMIRNRLSNSASLDDMVETMSNAGQRQGIISLIGITVLAKVWCDAMGIPNAWDDFDFTPEGDEEFHMPTVLMKFQNAGQIWLPNDTREDGTPYVNPNKRAYKLDPFFSMFTLPNSVMRSVDMFFNGDVNSYRAPQGGIGLLTNSLGADMYGINQFFNSPQWRAISDELIGSNLLSPYKAMHEIIVNRTYYGNNIWERKYLPDGSENPNYDPGRNVASSIMHLLGLDAVLDPNGYNRWVKGGDEMVYQDQIGTIAGSGILQHEYITAAISLMNGDLFDAMIEAGELPIKTQTLASDARTEMNTTVKNTLAHYSDSYHAAIKKARNVEEKDKAYAEYVKKCADEMARWSAKYDYLLGDNQQLVASATRLVMAMTSGEYDDNLAYIQNAYWKASKIAQIESGTNLFLGQDDLDDWIADGGTVESFIAEKNRRSAAYNQALDDEYEARKALIEANYNPEYLTSYSYEDLKAEQRSLSKKIYTSIMNKFENRVGEFDNYKEMQEYYLEMINNASSTRQKAKLANKYNDYVKDVIAEAIADYGPAVLTETSYNGDGITNQISDYIIIPADKYYTGKTPKSNYLKDLFGVGYRNRVNLPSDDELVERWDTAKWLVANGKPASASALLESVVKNIKNGRLYASDVDYSNIIRLKSKLRSKQ